MGAFLTGDDVKLQGAPALSTDAGPSATIRQSSTSLKLPNDNSPQHQVAPVWHQSPWFWVMCLTGVDYFSTLGYQPSIAFEAAGMLAPLATVVLVLLTLFGAVPVYSHVAGQSPHGQGSIAMLEQLVHGWKGKTLVLILLGFAATDFVITKTLSAADAAVHLTHNPYWAKMPAFIRQLSEGKQQMMVTMLLLVLLGASFLRGFREVIGLAVVIVGVYLTLNAIVIGSGLVYLLAHPARLEGWWQNVCDGNWHIKHLPALVSGTSLGSIAAICLLIFPKLALGLSGFETGVAVMPLIQGDKDDDPQNPLGRIRNTRKLMVTAALLMSVLLLSSSIVTATLIDPSLLGEGGVAQGRALAYLAHNGGPICPLFGEVFGTIYDLSTVVILSFAGASAMAGLLNLVPQYLPRYGMAPEWARVVRPLVLIFTAINLLVTWIFHADVEAQGGAYATGVLVLISSGCVATVIDRYRKSENIYTPFRIPWAYVFITAVFFYTTARNMIERPDGIKIASCFIVAVVVLSFWSRMRRSTELRFAGFEFVSYESRFLWDSLKHLEFPVLVPHRPGARDLAQKEQIIRERHRIADEVPIVFIEAELGDTSEFEQMPLMEIRQSEERFIIGVRRCASVAHVIATIALELSRAGRPPEVHFGWSNENPMAASISFLLFGEGNVPWMVRELIRRAEPNPTLQPEVFIG
ncbi:MAG TPA: hypothetical protein VFE46_07240 [Pirellulales bacterium]|jgi:hypothetical protein|nr:hypothetical protein [Pirellulales bacterium]